MVLRYIASYSLDATKKYKQEQKVVKVLQKLEKLDNNIVLQECQRVSRSKLCMLK